MIKILSIFTLIFVLFSCKQTGDPTTNEGNTEQLNLENKIKQLELDNSLKDSIINESLSYFNEIKSNLEAINVRKDEIRAKSNDAEISNNDKDWILQEIQHINFLREENAKKLKRMESQMKKNNLEIKELNLMIDNLVQDIKWKDEQIDLLQSELENKDREYTALFDAYQEQSRIVNSITEEMNTVYYAYGTRKELQSNEVIEKKNGFLGIGKNNTLKGEINEEYFTKLNASKTKKIVIFGKNPTFVTTHPSNSYKLTQEGSKTTITILDPSEFWKISKYFVATVD